MRHVVFALLFFVVLAGMASAHEMSDGKLVGDKLLIVQYSHDVGEEITAGDTVAFEFDLFMNDAVTKAEFDSVWVKIEEARPARAGGDRLLFSGILHRTLAESPTMSYVFHEPGEYDMWVQFRNGDTPVVAGEFTTEVLSNAVGVPIFGVLLLAALAALLLLP